MNRKFVFELVLPVLSLIAGAGCRGIRLTEISGKTAFGPEFRNFGNNTHDVRYTAVQGLEFKLSNKWNLGVSYQRRDVDEGSGDNENLVLFEVGYPIWNAPKKPEKTVEDRQIEELEQQLRHLGSELAAADQGSTGDASGALARSDKVE